MTKQSRSVPVMQAVLDAVAERLMAGDELLIRIPEICEATGVNYGSVYHHFGSREGVIDAAYNMILPGLWKKIWPSLAAAWMSRSRASMSMSKSWVRLWRRCTRVPSVELVGPCARASWRPLPRDRISRS